MAVLIDTKYQSDEGTIHKLRLTPVTVAVAGTPPAGDVDSLIPAKVSKSNSEFGVRPRRVRISRTIGTGDAAFRRYATFPVLTATAYNAIALNDTVTYDGATWTVISKNGEDY